MHSQNMRLSRVTYPRATWWVMALLIAVFAGFGMVAEACMDPTVATHLQP